MTQKELIQRIDSQTVGRMGELWVELELLRHGWLVGNFNASVLNSKGWDLFAVKGVHNKKIRVKAATGTDPVWNGAKPGAVPFPDLDPADPDDWTVIVTRTTTATPECYVLPTVDLAIELIRIYESYYSKPRRDGRPRKVDGRWWLFFEGRPDTGAGDRGYAVTFDKYRRGWPLLQSSG